MLLAHHAAGVGTGFTLPPETFTSQAQLAPLQQELSRESFTDAAARLDELLRDHVDELMPLDGGVLSFWSWLGMLPAEQRRPLIDAFGKRFDEAARGRLNDLRADRATTPEQFYAMARRYPFSSVTGLAMAAAGERALDLADVSTATVYFDLARLHGWAASPAQASMLDALGRYNRGETISVPNDAPASQPSAPSHYVGPFPVDAAWLNNPAAVGQGRFQPVAAGEKLFFSSSRSVSAVRESGQLDWSYIAPPTRAAPLPPPMPVPRKEDYRKLIPDRIDGAHRPAVHAPALLCDVYGNPQIVIARQSGEAPNEYILRAFRATDGKPLWSTDEQPQLRDLSFAGTPAIAGRFVYAVALLVDQPAHNNATVVLAALDTLTGQLQWQATIGVFTLPQDKRMHSPAIAPWDDVWEQTGPLVAGDAVYVTPNAGVAVKVGRFDGKVRWARPYVAARTNDDPARSKEELRKVMEDRRELLRQAKEARNHGLPPPVIQPPPLDPALTERYNGTPRLCGDRLIIAPADSFGVFALDAASGRQIWEKKEPEIPTLVGGTPEAAVFAGAAVMALSPANGQPLWKWEPPRGTWVTGPAVVVRQRLVHIPTNGSPIILNAKDGTVVKDMPPTATPSWRRVLASELLHKLIDDAGAGKSFGMPPAP